MRRKAIWMTFLSLCIAATSLLAQTTTEQPRSQARQSVSPLYEIFDLTNVTVTDSKAPDCDNFIGDLAIGASVSYSCTSPPVTKAFRNVAKVVANAEACPSTVKDSDRTDVKIPPPPTGDPKIEILKQISVNGGPFADADGPNDPDAPIVPAPSNALYRFIVRNIGDVDLVDVVVNDATLGILDFVVGPLGVGEEKILTEAEIPKLFVVMRCAEAGTFTNVAVASGESAVDGTPVSDDDPANLVCESAGICLVIIDQEGIDNDIKTIEAAAASHGVLPDVLVNDDRPTEVGNPPLVWNTDFAGDVVLLPTGQVDDEGWFAPPPPPAIRYVDGNTTSLSYDELDRRLCRWNAPPV